jgi:hypothetical protein
LRDTEIASLYLDSSLFEAQQGVAVLLDYWLSKYRYSYQIVTCQYATVILKQSDRSGILVGNHLVLASSIAHPYPYTVADSSALLSAKHTRDVDFVYAWTMLFLYNQLQLMMYMIRISKAFFAIMITYGRDGFSRSCESDVDRFVM